MFPEGSELARLREKLVSQEPKPRDPIPDFILGVIVGLLIGAALMWVVL